MKYLSDDDIRHTPSIINPPLPPSVISDPDGCVSGDCCDINRICDRLHGCSHPEHHPSLPGQFCQSAVSVLSVIHSLGGTVKLSS